MYITQPATLTELYVNNSSTRNQYEGMLNANFQDYMDSLAQGGQYEVKAAQLKKRISAVASGLGMAIGTLGGPAGMPLGFAIGNSIGKFIGNTTSQRIYGQALADMADIAHEAKVRHAQLAISLAFTNQIDGAIDTLRQNENKRKKDDLQAMQV
ncbi:MAG: hypothetical protein A3B68_01435 [Candidatus Melainabacteria bacterium RIFCSPHIGHO2_02_FULL_34_12]|nr:MAG: hypothetical protein A3B68_01435 [Candidatus Melainabacteria bacterium RIFCSPHIGHO2_02_FULL_34_12]